ncbi:uncharacterized protein LOC117601754 [Osmia lignaria lignaria]|uniref:uncharacterized protein LOC117601754 n=1 Tax=Osmia lignaria lignaria TaxID=1437193 RepID=UPI00402B547C
MARPSFPTTRGRHFGNSRQCSIYSAIGRYLTKYTNRRVENKRSFQEDCCTAPQIDALAHTTTCLIGRNERTPTWDDQSQPSIEVSKCFETLILIVRERHVQDGRSFEEDCCTPPHSAQRTL